MKTLTNRAKKTGRFTLSGDMTRLCVCGRTLAVHDAESPHGFEDLSLDSRDLPACEKAVLAK